MEKLTIKNSIIAIIVNKIGTNVPFRLADISEYIPDVKYSTIKVNVKRLLGEKIINKSKNGVYYLPKAERVLKDKMIDVDIVINKEYIRDSSGHRVGYYSGINLAQSLGLTTQTASIETIYSNLVANKKRTILIENRKFNINAPRYKITDYNYRILQVLDILNSLDKVSEVSIEKAKDVIANYLKETTINDDELKRIVKSYPLRTQLLFFEIGVDHIIVQR